MKQRFKGGSGAAISKNLYQFSLFVDSMNEMVASRIILLSIMLSCGLPYRSISHNVLALSFEISNPGMPESFCHSSRLYRKLMTSTGGFSTKFRVGGCRPQFQNVTVG